jgi:signal transduction histidine kinase
MIEAAKISSWSVALAWAAVLFCASPGLASEPPALQSIAAVKSQANDLAAPSSPVRVRGVVTWLEENGESGAIQDASAGIWMTVDFARRMGILDPATPHPLKGLEPGMEVEIEGLVTRHGPSPRDNLYSAMVMPRTVTVIGRKPIPEPREADHPFLFSGAADHLRVEVRGIVQGFREAENAWLLFVDAEPGEVGALFPKAALSPNPAMLVDAEVRIRGVCGACYNRRGDFLSPRIHMIGADDLVVERQPPSQPFDAPEVPLVGLAAYGTAPQNGHRMRVQGVVTYVWSGQCFYIQEGSTGVRIETRDTVPVHVGDRVEVAGFLTMNRRIAGLKEAVVRSILTDGGPEPAATTLSELELREAAADGLLVTLRARLLEAQRIADGCQLMLATDKAGFVAKLHGADVRRLLTLQGGSELSLTGIVEMDLTYDFRIRPNIERIGLLLRSPADVQVVRGPSWWTPRRLLQVVAGLAAVLLVAFAWGLLLRRQVIAQAAQLAQEMRTRRDAAVEFDATLRERNRLAANLHDTLLQTLGGIGYQLEACEVSGRLEAAETKKHFDTAQRMVDHAMSQLHDSVWTLRSLPLRNRTFPEALRALADRIGEEYDTAIGLETEGLLEDLPDFVAGNLLLVVQEAVSNAIRHGHASAVEIAITADSVDSRIDLTIRDNGLGFVPGAQPSVEQGHFGIEGMRERVERLGGGLQIESTPGGGTTLRANVSRSAYDEELV